MLGLVADPVIEAIARLEFEDGLMTGVLLGGLLRPLDKPHLAHNQLQTSLKDGIFHN